MSTDTAITPIFLRFVDGYGEWYIGKSVEAILNGLELSKEARPYEISSEEEARSCPENAAFIDCRIQGIKSGKWDFAELGERWG